LISVGAGLERATSGRVELLGTDLGDMTEDALARLRRGRVSMVFQSFHLLPTMTALDNVRVALEIAGMDDALERARHLRRSTLRPGSPTIPASCLAANVSV
jgi:putative ABC transport system ATP-binding protein